MTESLVIILQFYILNRCVQFLFNIQERHLRDNFVILDIQINNVVKIAQHRHTRNMKSETLPKDGKFILLFLYIIA